jgi:hypothetical protein
VHAESLAAPLSQQLGFFSGKEIKAFVIHTTNDTLLDRSENCLNCSFKQDAIAMHINTADVRLIRNIPGANARLSKRKEKMHSLPRLDYFPGCLHLSDCSCDWRWRRILAQFPAQLLRYQQLLHRHAACAQRFPAISSHGFVGFDTPEV